MNQIGQIVFVDTGLSEFAQIFGRYCDLFLLSRRTNAAFRCMYALSISFGQHNGNARITGRRGLEVRG
jgi:hypothetical protein